MKYFGTRHHSPAALLLLLVLGCKGKIGAPEGLPASRDTTQPAAVQSAAPPSQLNGDNAAAGPGDTPGMGDSTQPQGMDKPVQGPRYQCSRPELRGTNQMSLRRLTKDEYLQSAAAVFGAAVVDTAEVQQAAAQIPAETTGDITREFQNAPSYDHVAGILMTAQAIANTVVGNAATSARIFGACAEHADRDCAAKFLTSGATRILRRPLDAQRRVAMLDAFTFAGEGNDGLKLLLARVLQAPEAVFHMAWPRQQCAPAANSIISEQEDKCIDEAPQGAVSQVDDWTVADRIAYALTGHGPDQELLDAAALGELRSPDQARPHALRLMKLPEARKQLEAILDSWLTLRTLPTPAAAVAENAGIDARDLSEEARRELLDYAVWEILDNEADAQTLMIDPVGFPRSERMAMLYGVSAIAKGTEPVDLVNGHGGLLVRIAPLLSGQLRTSPILRGVYVRKRLLCDELLQPDFAVVQARTESLHALDQQKLSSREVAQKITEPAQCMVCHTQINPLGFILEGFDALGSRRDEELELDEKGREIAALPVVTKVDQANIEDGAPQQLADAAELVRTLATSTKYQACVAERLYTQTQMRHPSATDLCALSEIEAVVRGKSVKEAWLAAVLNADTFIRKAPQ